MGKAPGMVVWGLVVIGAMCSGASGSAQEKPAKAGQGGPITKAEALEVGKGLARGIASLDAKAVEQAMDVEAMMEAAADGVEVQPQYREGFLKGAREARERDGPPLLAELRPAVQSGGVVRATKGMEWQGRPAFVLRVNWAGGAASYLLVLVERRPDGRIRAVDYYSLASGELASQAAHRIYLSGVAQVNRGILDRVLGKDQVFFKHMSDLTRMATANRAGRAQEVLTIYETLPEELKNEKVFQVLRYSAAQKIGDEAKYLEAIQDFARRFPGDPACDFLLIDGYLLMKQPEKSLDCIKRLEKTIGDDAYLEVLRGNLMTLMKRPDDALAAYRAAIAQEPDLKSAHEGLLGLAVERKQFGEVAKILDTLESKLGLEIADLTKIDLFAEFLASPEGKAWAKAHKPKPGGEKLEPGEEKSKP